MCLIIIFLNLRVIERDIDFVWMAWVHRGNKGRYERAQIYDNISYYFLTALCLTYWRVYVVYNQKSTLHYFTKKDFFIKISMSLRNCLHIYYTYIYKYVGRKNVRFIYIGDTNTHVNLHQSAVLRLRHMKLNTIDNLMLMVFFSISLIIIAVKCAMVCGTQLVDTEQKQIVVH